MPRLARYPSCDRVRSVRGKLEPDVADGQRSANAPSQGRQDVLSAAVLAFREPLAQLAGDRAGHTVALEPSEQFLLAGGEFHARKVPTHLGGQALPQEIHATSPPLGQSLASLYRDAVTRLPLQRFTEVGPPASPTTMRRRSAFAIVPVWIYSQRY